MLLVRLGEQADYFRTLAFTTTNDSRATLRPPRQTRKKSAAPRWQKRKSTRPGKRPLEAPLGQVAPNAKRAPSRAAEVAIAMAPRRYGLLHAFRFAKCLAGLHRGPYHSPLSGSKSPSCLRPAFLSRRRGSQHTLFSATPCPPTPLQTAREKIERNPARFLEPAHCRTANDG